MPTMASDRIDRHQAYGVHIDLTCQNHRDLRWSTKNIAPIGCRSLFWRPALDSNYRPTQDECTCPVSDLIVAPRERGQ
jgi:hypothetical protein